MLKNLSLNQFSSFGGMSNFLSLKAKGMGLFFVFFNK